MFIKHREINEGETNLFRIYKSPLNLLKKSEGKSQFQFQRVQKLLFKKNCKKQWESEVGSVKMLQNVWRCNKKLAGGGGHDFLVAGTTPWFHDKVIARRNLNMQRVRRSAKKKKRKGKEEKRKKREQGWGGWIEEEKRGVCTTRPWTSSTTTLRFRGGKILFRFVTACTKLSVIYEPVQLPGTGPSTLKIYERNAKIDGRAVAVIIIINHRGHRTRILRAPVNLYCLLGRDVL